MSARRVSVHLAGLAVAACTFAVAYAALRCAQAWFYPAADPRDPSPVLRIAFFYRCGLALFAAILGFLGGSALAARPGPTFESEVLPWIVIATIAVGTLQGIFVP